VPRHAKDLSWRKLFHGAAVTTGGERSCISAAVSLSTTTIGPAHLGHDNTGSRMMTESQALSALRSLDSTAPDSEFVVIEKIDPNSSQVAQESLAGAQSIHVETYGQGVFVNLMRAGGFDVLEFNSKSKSATSLHLVTLDASAQALVKSYAVDGDLGRTDALMLIKKSDEFSIAFLKSTGSEVARLLRTFGGAEVGVAGTADQRGYLGVPETVTKLAQTPDELLNLRGQYSALQLWPVRYAPSIPLFAANPEEATRLARNELIKLARSCCIT
jgi:hypothetical protein